MESTEQSSTDRAASCGCGVHDESERHAVAVDPAIKDRNLKRLRRICCYWGAREERLRDGRGRDYYLSMASPETMHNTRPAWREIEHFEVAVVTYTEEI